MVDLRSGASVHAEPEGPLRRAPGPQTIVTLTRPVVLVVDDTTETRGLMRRLLERDGMQVVEASGGREAMRAVTAGGPDAIVLDLRLPGMSGLEIARQIRADPDPRRTAIPILACSASLEADIERRAVDAGCNDFLGKPFDIATFADRVRALLPVGDGDRHT